MWIKKSINSTIKINKENEDITKTIIERFKDEADIEVKVKLNRYTYIFQFYVNNCYQFAITITNDEINEFVDERGQYKDRECVLTMLLSEKLEMKEMKDVG